MELGIKEPSLDPEGHGLSGDGGQGDKEFTCCRCGGDDIVLRTDGDSQRLHIDGGRAVSILDGELKDGKLRCGLVERVSC